MAAFVQKSTRNSASGTGTGWSITTAFSTPPTVGNYIFVMTNPWILNKTLPTVQNITDNYGNSYTKAVDNASTPGGGNFYAQIWFAPVTTTGAGFTLTYTLTLPSSDTYDSYVQAAEFSGAISYDSGTFNDVQAGTTLTTSFGTLPSSNSLVIAVANFSGDGASPTSGWTNIDKDFSNLVQNYSFDYKTQYGSSADVPATWTLGTTQTICGVEGSWKATVSAAAKRKILTC